MTGLRSGEGVRVLLLHAAPFAVGAPGMLLGDGGDTEREEDGRSLRAAAMCLFNCQEGAEEL